MTLTTTLDPYYYTDDATLIGKFIEKEWNLSPKLCKKPIVAYTPDYDVDSFDYTTGDMLCYVTYDNTASIVKGISFDGYSETGLIMIRMRCRSEQALYIATDEIERILTNHRVEPGNNWNLLIRSAVTNIYPKRKFSERDITYMLKCFWKPAVKPTA